MSRAAGLGSRFIALNQQCCQWIERHLPKDFTRHLHTVYKYQVAELINSRAGQLVLDIGAGRECPFLPFVGDNAAPYVIGIDFSEEELLRNHQLAMKVVANAGFQRLPVRDDTADIVVSRSVVEHLTNNRAFFANCASVLRPGGVIVHTFPCRFAPFALINRLIPNWLARRLLAWFQPHWSETCGFPAYYDRCSFSQIRQLLHANGFRNERYVFRYYQSIYFDFFVPLYLVMLAYDLLVWALGARNLACALLVTAEKPAALQPGE